MTVAYKKKRNTNYKDRPVNKRMFKNIKITLQIALDNSVDRIGCCKCESVVFLFG